MFVALALALLSPQEATALSGRVLDARGTPVASATVTLLHRPIARDLDTAREHRVVATTDARGTFRAAVRADAAYSVWAATPAVATGVAENVTAGTFVELCVAAGTAPRHVAVQGLDQWTEAAGFRYRALVGSENLDFAAVERVGDALIVPPLPPMECRAIEVLAANGEPLWGESLPGDNPLVVPPPATLTLSAHDDRGVALADVEVRRHVCNYWMTQSDAVFYGDRFRALWPVVGRTDAAGRLSMRTPMPPEAKTLWLLSRKDGCQMSLDGLDDGKRFANGCELPAAQQSGATNHFDVTLRAAAPQAIPLRTPDGKPLAVQTLFLGARVHVKNLAGGRIGNPFHLATPVVDGVANLLAPLPAPAELDFAWTQLAPSLRNELQQLHGFAPPIPFRIPSPEHLLGRFVPPDPGVATWQELHVVAADGRPASNTVVQVRETANSPGVLYRTDRLGRVLFELRRDARVAVCAAAGWGAAAIAVAENQPTRLLLRAMSRVTGTVVDATGKPAAGCAIAFGITHDADAGCLANELDQLAGLLPVGPSDPHGRFDLLLPGFGVQVALRVTGADPRESGSSLLDWDPDRPTPIEVTLPRR